jgi:hypothetical protein
LDHCSILNPWQLVLWGCMLMGSLMAWHHRVAEPLCSLQRREHGMHVTLTLLALCSMLPSTQARDVPGLYSVQHVPSHRRELQTTVSNSASLTSALANTAVGHIVLAPGTYYLSAELSITRSVILEAAVAGSVVLHAQASFSIQRRVLLIDPGSSGVVQLIKLNITGGNFGWVSSAGPNGGGGVYVSSGTVTITFSTISGNTAYNYYGGGVAVWGGTVTISSCTISGNTASHNGEGGGVFIVFGSVTIDSCTISGNTQQLCVLSSKFPIARWESC